MDKKDKFHHQIMNASFWLFGISWGIAVGVTGWAAWYAWVIL